MEPRTGEEGAVAGAAGAAGVGLMRRAWAAAVRARFAAVRPTRVDPVSDRLSATVDSFPSVPQLFSSSAHPLRLPDEPAALELTLSDRPIGRPLRAGRDHFGGECTTEEGERVDAGHGDELARDARAELIRLLRHGLRRAADRRWLLDAGSEGTLKRCLRRRFSRADARLGEPVNLLQLKRADTVAREVTERVEVRLVDRLALLLEVRAPDRADLRADLGKIHGEGVAELAGELLGRRKLIDLRAGRTEDGGDRLRAAAATVGGG